MSKTGTVSQDFFVVKVPAHPGRAGRHLCGVGCAHPRHSRGGQKKAGRPSQVADLKGESHEASIAASNDV